MKNGCRIETGRDRGTSLGSGGQLYCDKRCREEQVVTLSGHLETFTDKHAAERALRRVTGVKVIALELDVKLSSNHQRSNIDVAAVAEEALRWNTGVPPDKTQL